MAIIFAIIGLLPDLTNVVSEIRDSLKDGKLTQDEADKIATTVISFVYKFLTIFKISHGTDLGATFKAISSQAANLANKKIIKP
jgi:hypothetical protein